MKTTCKYYQIAGMTIRVGADMPMEEDPFHPKLQAFRTETPGEDMIRIHHHFALPPVDRTRMGKPVYRIPPWEIYREKDEWVYLGISTDEKNEAVHQVIRFSDDHSRAEIFNDGTTRHRGKDIEALTFMPTDQILLARVLADRQGCLLHAAGIIFKERGYIFVGHSGAGKSSLVRKLKGLATILSDDRVIVTISAGAPCVHGTWHHGEVPDISPNSAPLTAIYFIEKETENCVIPVPKGMEMARKLIPCLIKPFTTGTWWEKTLSLMESISTGVPGYRLRVTRDIDPWTLLRLVEEDRPSPKDALS